MRIALATSSFAPHTGGVEEHVRSVAGLLAARGHDVVVWTVARNGIFSRRTVDGIDVWDLPAPLPSRSLRGLLGFGVRLPSAVIHWARAAKAARPDVINIQCYGPNGTYGRLLARILRTPLVVSSHGETLADDNGVFDSSWLAQASLRRAIRDAVVVTTCSRVVVEDLVERFGLPRSKSVVVYNGVHLDEAVAADENRLPARYIAAVGRLQPVKGFDALIRAFARADLPPEVMLVIGGDGPMWDELRAQADALDIGARVILLGRLSRPEVGRVLARAAAVAVPSRFEAFGITVLEAWRAGAPVVATVHGGPLEFVEDGVDGLLRDPHDTDAFAAALTDVVNDLGRGREMARRASIRVRAFTWESVVDRYEGIFRAL